MFTTAERVTISGVFTRVICSLNFYQNMLKKTGYLIGYISLAVVCSCSIVCVPHGTVIVPIKPTDSVVFKFDATHHLDTLKVIPGTAKIPAKQF